MTLDFTQASYNFAITRIAALLNKPSKPGSSEDAEIADLGRFIEDFETSRKGTAFEPYYVEQEVTKRNG